MLADLRLAISFLTRLPLPHQGGLPPGSLGRAMRFFPVAGLLVGALGGAVFALAHAILPAAPAAVLALTATVAVTGALHEDGLADVADGFGGGADKESKLAIMRDSRIGSYGVVAVALGLALRATVLANLPSAGLVAGSLIAAHALARAAIPLVLLGLEPARADGLGAAAGRPTPGVVTTAAVIALVIAVAILPVIAAIAAALAAAVAAVAMAGLARRQIGGQTGDVLGAVEQVAETAALLAVLGAL
jgi:adenosylcobinamide-GDP ribazoletransferase